MSSGRVFIWLDRVNSFAEYIASPATRQRYGKQGSISKALAFCLNSSRLCLCLIQYRGERGHKEHKGEMQSNRQGDVLSKGKKGEKGDTHTHTKNELFISWQPFLKEKGRNGKAEGKGEVKDATLELQRCGILLEGSIVERWAASKQRKVEWQAKRSRRRGSSYTLRMTGGREV